MISPLEQAYFNLKFDNAFMSTKGEAFQTFFSKLMGMAHKVDFMACRPWGKEGDRKNDGFLRSKRLLFQVYAPNEMKAAEAIAKIKEDFDGAKVHWGKHFDSWAFVHNAVDGLPPHVHELLLELKKTNSGITLEVWGQDQLRQVFKKLSLTDLQDWFGYAPSDGGMLELGFGDLQVVLETIADRQVPPAREVKEVPMGKIEANALSENVTVLLKAGMIKAPLVGAFFEQWHDETLGERVAESFRSKYKTLRGEYSPDDIFSALMIWAGGSSLGPPKHQIAVLAVLAYYFASCDIYEQPEGSVS